MLWAMLGAGLTMAAVGLFPRWHWAAQIGLAMAAGTAVVGVYYGALGG